jgi:hypothetical protein
VQQLLDTFDALPEPEKHQAAGVFDAQQVVTVPQARLIRKLGDLAADPFALVEEAVRRWLGL